MKLFKVTVFDYFFDVELSGEFEAETSWDAEEQARELYAFDLGTTMEEIDVVAVEEIEKADTSTTTHPQAKNKAPHHEEGLNNSIAWPEQKVNLGQVYTTPSVSEEMGRNDWFRYDVHAAVGRFSAGDWGAAADLGAEIDTKAVDAAADKIVGVYDTQAGRLWVMAEPWAAATTILFENEY